MGYPTSPVRLKDPGPTSVMDYAKKLAEDVKFGRITADRATRLLISRLSYFRPDRIPSYSAKYICACSDLIYSAEMKSPSYLDPATEEAERMLRDAVKGVMGST